MLSVSLCFTPPFRLSNANSYAQVEGLKHGGTENTEENSGSSVAHYPSCLFFRYCDRQCETAKRIRTVVASYSPFLQATFAMSPQDALDLVRAAIVMSLILAAPLLVVGMVVGLVISLIQALTQVQDQTVSTVPKLFAIVLAMILCLPWMTDRMVEYSRDLFRDIPNHISQR